MFFSLTTISQKFISLLLFLLAAMITFDEDKQEKNSVPFDKEISNERNVSIK